MAAGLDVWRKLRDHYASEIAAGRDPVPEFTKAITSIDEALWNAQTLGPPPWLTPTNSTTTPK